GRARQRGRRRRGAAAFPRGAVVISPNLRIDGFEPDEWTRLRRLLLPVRPDGTPAITPPLVVLLERRRAVKALRPLGPVEHIEADVAPLGWRGPASLAAARRACGARVAVAIEAEAGDRIAAALDAGLSPRQDLVEQLLVGVRAARAEMGRGLHVDPDL